ncbi:putative conserved protein, DUF305 family [Abditibacterium utsteinense]|uniref:Putative conserved protein, DUF305 family n=1 Tax=Abditibacterium utsteinense TaxID=1960156 RepID=A0A2S8SPI3_9BACT|nr:DUF305 domain-containing protein [Abditibacterium utsteinense]PQV62701.1 putative conserved protein, DUF305 family [Abditibacterium utsteinense]
MKIQHLGTLAALTLTLGAASTPAHAAPFDEQFIDSMTPHHQSALVMAQMAITKAKYPEVRALARGIIADQKKEIAYMGQLHRRFYPDAKDMPSMDMKGMSGMKMGGMKMSGDKMMMPGMMMGLPMKGMMDMGKLKSASGANFDKMFLKMMIPHHAGAISMADEALNVSGRPEIRGLAMKIIDAQANEIGKMHDIYDRRFGSLAKG